MAAALPELALQSRAPSTIKKYSGAFCHWKKWAAAKSEIGPNLPPKPINIALYLSFLVQHCRSSAPLMEAVSALPWVNKVAIIPEILSTLVDKFGNEKLPFQMFAP